MTTETRILPVSEIVAWCPECEIWDGGSAAGDSCPMEGHDTRSGSRKLVRRRGWVCREEDCFQVLFSKAAFCAHSCGDAY